MSDAFYADLVVMIRRRVPVGTLLSPRVVLMGGNGRAVHLVHEQTETRISRDRDGRALTAGTGRRIGAALAEQLSKAV